MIRLFRIATILIAAAILYLSLIPTQSTPDLQISDKINHFIAYGALAGGLALGWPRLPIWAVIGGCASFGVGLELIQGLDVVGRSASILDAVANFLGATIAAVGVRLIRHMMSRFFA